MSHISKTRCGAPEISEPKCDLGYPPGQIPLSFARYGASSYRIIASNLAPRRVRTEPHIRAGRFLFWG